jgi:hypothetical protein
MARCQKIACLNRDGRAGIHMRRRAVPSPDEWDAVALTFCRAGGAQGVPAADRLPAAGLVCGGRATRAPEPGAARDLRPLSVKSGLPGFPGWRALALLRTRSGHLKRPQFTAPWATILRRAQRHARVQRRAEVLRHIKGDDEAVNCGGLKKKAPGDRGKGWILEVLLSLTSGPPTI